MKMQTKEECLMERNYKFRYFMGIYNCISLNMYHYFI